MNSVLVGKLIEGATLITPTRRLASYCQERIALILAKTYPAWETVAIYSIEDWYKTRWSLNEMTREGQKHLLTPTQSLLAYENIIVHSELGGTILDPYQTAKTAFEAWKILNQWRALALLERETTQIDTQTFVQWTRQYREFLETSSAIDYAMLPETILTMLVTEPPQSLLFYGFEEKTPFLEYCVETLEHRGWDVAWELPQAIVPKKCVRQAYLDEEKEQEAAVRFAIRMQQAGKKNIAIVVPQLADHRQKLDRLLREAFDPLEIGSPLIEVNPNFNISAAVPLVNYPLISVALACLRLGLESFSFKDYQRVVDSPWLHDAAESSLRYVHLMEIKRWHRGALSLEVVLHYLKKSESHETSWRQRISSLIEMIKVLPKSAPYYQWATIFQTCLKKLGWPANSALTSTEFQTLMRFETLLQELSDCDRVLVEASYRTALFTLQKLASYIPFQPENKGAPVQVLGVLEAAGQQFDALWVMGMQSEAWPPPAKHNPFIDLEEQRRRLMPHASADREMQYAMNMTSRFKQSAPEVIFSYAMQNKERKWDVSELCRDLPLQSDEPVENESLVSPDVLESLLDSVAPPLGSDEMLRATTRLLELQSACPFRAFAEYRLGASQQLEKSIWLQASDQGTILHSILEKWWTLYPILEANAPREATLEPIIQGVLKKHLSPHVPQAYIEVEVFRLQKILREYFELEAKRPFFRVVESEFKHAYTLGQLHFSIRCDRLDEDANGRRLIVDYKTGKFSLQDWEGERLASPQLPLYALAFDSPSPSALMVISLRSSECQYIGMASEDLGITGLRIKENFEAIKQQWRIQLSALSDDFASGQAQVDPRNKESTCQYCHLGALCRIREKEALYDL